MARDEERNWLDDAFDESKPDPLDRGRKDAPGADYDWIDDAFDDSKEDPLAAKGMTGCSSLAVLVCGVLAVVVVLFFAFSAASFVAPLIAGSAL